MLTVMLRNSTFVLFGVALLGGAALAEAPRLVHQRGKVFAPEHVALLQGESLRIGNADPFIHHVFVDSPRLKYDSGDQRPGKEIVIRFDEAGEYVVQCAIHLKMKLTVSVR